MAAQIVNLPDVRSTVASLEKESSDSSVWEDTARAQTLMQDLSAAKDRLQEAQHLEALLADAETAVELAEAEVSTVDERLGMFSSEIDCTESSAANASCQAPQRAMLGLIWPCCLRCKTPGRVMRS